MSALPIVNDFAEKVRLLHVEAWSAWRIGERESDALTLDEPETLDEVTRQVMGAGGFDRGDKFAVQFSHTGRGKRTLWLFHVKRSTKVYDYRQSYDGGAPVRVGRLYPGLMLQTELAADFAPVLRFDALRGDPVGIDRTLVDAR